MFYAWMRGNENQEHKNLWTREYNGCIYCAEHTELVGNQSEMCLCKQVSYH